MNSYWNEHQNAYEPENTNDAVNQTEESQNDTSANQVYEYRANTYLSHNPYVNPMGASSNQPVDNMAQANNIHNDAQTDAPASAAENAHHTYYESPFTPSAASDPLPSFDQPKSSSSGYVPPTAIVAVTPKPKRKKRGLALFLAGTAACMALSLAAGFGGSMLAQNFSAAGSNKLQSSNNGANVVQTSTGTGGLSVAEIAARNGVSIVEITTETMQYGNRMQQFVASGAGSGIIVTADGYIATNNHVIADASKITVRLKDGKEYTAKLIGTDAKTDLAVIKIEATGLTPVTFGDSSTLQVGDTAVAIGNPLGELGGTVTDGIISALDREIEIDNETMILLQTSAAINPGNSGGGLFNSAGELVGVVNAKSSGTGIEGLGFAIPSNTAKSVIESLIANGYVKGRPAIGLSLQEVTDQSQNQNNFYFGMPQQQETAGVYVVQVSSDHAKKAGFEIGDRIVSVDGTAVKTVSDLSKIIDSKKVGDTLKVVVERDSGQTTLTATLGEAAQN